MNAPENVTTQKKGLPYWRDYPEQDTEIVRLYPPTYKPITPEEIWTKEKMTLYCHIPFCQCVCYSCPFRKIRPTEEKVENYCAAMTKEIRYYARQPYVQDHELVVVYLGGGTPTTLATDQLSELITLIFNSFNFDKNYEFTLESTPQDLTAEKAKMAFDSGVNRISIGVQSFNDDELKHMGRGHNVQDAEKSIEIARNAGFESVGIDILYGLPGQTLESWKKTVQRAIDLKLVNINFIHFVWIKNNANIIRNIRNQVPYQSPREERKEMFFRAVDMLQKKGYNGYHMDEFSLPGFESARVQRNFGEALDEIGVGSSAMAYMKNTWYVNEADVSKYIERINQGELPPVVYGHKLSKEDQMRRALVIGMKAARVSRKKFKDRYGVDLADLYQDAINQLAEQGLIKLTDEAIEMCLPKGAYYSDNICKAFYDKKYKYIPQLWQW